MRRAADHADDEVYSAVTSAYAAEAKPLDTERVGWRPFVPGMLALTKTSIGSGVLALPYAVSHVGWGLGLVFLVLTWGGGFVGQSMLFASAHRAGGRDTSWYSMAECTYPWLSIFVDVIIGIKCVGVAASYLIVIGTLLPATVVASPGSFLLTKTFWITVFGCGFCFPLSCLPNVKSLRFSSMFGLLAVVYVAVLVVVFCAAPDLTGACSAVPAGQPCAPGISAGPNGEDADIFHVFETIPTFVFAFMMNTNVFMIFNEAPVQEPRVTLKRIAAPAQIVMLSVDLVVAYCGYFTYGTNVKSNILQVRLIKIRVRKLGIRVRKIRLLARIIARRVWTVINLTHSEQQHVAGKLSLHRARGRRAGGDLPRRSLLHPAPVVPCARLLGQRGAANP